MLRKKGLKGMILYLVIIFSVLVLFPVILLIISKSNTDEKGIRLPIIMYHDISDNPSSLDDYTISPEQFEDDLAAFKQEGWEPVSLSSVLDYVHKGGFLPQKPVLLVFDDGYKSFLTKALPILEKYQAPAVVSVIGERAENPQKYQDDCHEYMDWDDLRAVCQSGLVELQSHSDHLHHYSDRVGVGRLSCESSDDYMLMLKEDVQSMQQLFESQQLSLLPSFAYPYGRLEPLAETVLRDSGFIASMTSEERVSLLTSDVDSLFLLGRFNRSGYISAQDVIAWMECEPT